MRLLSRDVTVFPDLKYELSANVLTGLMDKTREIKPQLTVIIDFWWFGDCYHY